jgi:predicted dehydrogenase
MTSTNAPRILIIGAGSRGHSYANAITAHSAGRIVGIAEPVSYKRQEFVRLYEVEDDSLVFSSWSELVALGAEEVGKKVDGVCICTLDETHLEVDICYFHLYTEH